MSASMNELAVTFPVVERDGFGMIVMLEDEDGATQPIAVCSSASEAGELATDDLKRRMRGAEGLAPYCYKLWTRNWDGYVMLYEAVV
jgi:hypothetical protein